MGDRGSVLDGACSPAVVRSAVEPSEVEAPLAGASGRGPVSDPLEVSLAGLAAGAASTAGDPVEAVEAVEAAPAAEDCSVEAAPSPSAGPSGAGAQQASTVGTSVSDRRAPARDPAAAWYRVNRASQACARHTEHWRHRGNSTSTSVSSPERISNEMGSVARRVELLLGSDVSTMTVHSPAASPPTRARPARRISTLD